MLDGSADRELCGQLAQAGLVGAVPRARHHQPDLEAVLISEGGDRAVDHIQALVRLETADEGDRGNLRGASCDAHEGLALSGGRDDEALERHLDARWSRAEPLQRLAVPADGGRHRAGRIEAQDREAIDQAHESRPHRTQAAIAGQQVPREAI